MGREYPPYYLTAYGLAVKRGFNGTLDDWLASLKADEIELRYQNEKLQWRRISDSDAAEEDTEYDPDDPRAWRDLMDMTTFYKQITNDLANFKQQAQTDFSNWADNSKVEILYLLEQLEEELDMVKDGSAYLLKSGDAMKGPLVLLGPLILTEGVHYGPSEPSTGVEGQLFLVEIPE